ncbi:hypothetical protein diail_9042 [Diaporthe ilicicola]|nr:hypothetical protein diail_9042 [Diaporthe ilicicola]
MATTRWNRSRMTLAQLEDELGADDNGSMALLEEDLEAQLDAELEAEPHQEDQPMNPHPAKPRPAPPENITLIGLNDFTLSTKMKTGDRVPVSSREESSPLGTFATHNHPAPDAAAPKRKPGTSPSTSHIVSWPGTGTPSSTLLFNGGIHGSMNGGYNDGIDGGINDGIDHEQVEPALRRRSMLTALVTKSLGHGSTTPQPAIRRRQGAYSSTTEVNPLLDDGSEPALRRQKGA